MPNPAPPPASWTDAAAGAPPGFTLRPSADGTGVELVPTARPEPFSLTVFLMLFAVIWNGITWSIIVATIQDPKSVSWNDGPGPPPWWFLALFALIGLGVVIGAFYAALSATLRWSAGPGWLARRGRLPLLGSPWERVYRNLDRLEIRHGIWENGVASTDTLRFQQAGERRPITIQETQHYPGMEQLRRRMLDPTTGKTSWRQLSQLLAQDGRPEGGRVDVEPRLLALGQFLSRQTGTPLTILEEVIPVPQSGGGG